MLLRERPLYSTAVRNAHELGWDCQQGGKGGGRFQYVSPEPKSQWNIAFASQRYALKRLLCHGNTAHADSPPSSSPQLTYSYYPTAVTPKKGSEASGLCSAPLRGGFSAGAMYLAHSSRALDDIVSWKRELLCLKNGSYLSVPHAG